MLSFPQTWGERDIIRTFSSVLKFHSLIPIPTFIFIFVFFIVTANVDYAASGILQGSPTPGTDAFIDSLDLVSQCLVVFDQGFIPIEKCPLQGETSPN